MNLSRLLLALPLVALACGGNEPPAAAPSGPAPTETTTTTSTTTTSTTPASSAPAVGQATCTSADVKGAADKAACMAKCAPLGDKAPEGSRCLPPKTECQMSCDHMFKAAK